MEITKDQLRNRSFKDDTYQFILGDQKQIWVFFDFDTQSKIIGVSICEKHKGRHDFIKMRNCKTIEQLDQLINIFLG